MNTKDHIFLIANSNFVGWAFCPVKESKIKNARQKVDKILEKKCLEYQIHYLGVVDYKEMDKTIINFLNKFQKYGSVWLLLNEDFLED